MTPEQFEAINEMVARRMQNTGENRIQACRHINRYLERRQPQQQENNR
ncbi:hypothetical protein SynBIOSU31_02080 [Synechococcus sp. BIOS-U3-1]|nr:hypothetical protein [Synechococcus sp. BIOS-U3-1]QNI58946.1 hypothetical protein SynBIOSU31_02080 [Synechococcus sp. BIOS-U3-1]